MISSTISSLLGLTTNNEWWVLAGLAFWALAHLELYTLGEKVLGYVVTQTLAIIPLGIFVFSLIVSVQRFSAKHWIEGLLFLVVAVASGIYFLLGGLKNEEKNTNVDRIDRIKHKIKELIKLGVFKATPDDSPTKVAQLLIASALILGVVALGLYAGWQLIQGSEALGVGLGVVGVVLAVACRWPRWNPAAKAYSVLAKINKEIAQKETGAPASATTSD